MRPSRFVFGSSSVDWMFGSFLLFRWLLPFHFTACFNRSFSPWSWFNCPFFSSQSLFDGVRLRLQKFLRIKWAILVRVLGCPKLVFYWSAAWLSWPPLWWGVISFQNFRTLKLGLYFCVDFLASSELIGYVDLTDSYETWPKCSPLINA